MMQRSTSYAEAIIRNESVNNSLYFNYDESGADDEMHIYQTITTIRNVLIPIIVLIGILGNTISISVFTSNYLRNTSSSAFLAALAFTDNIFLLMLFLTWYDGTIDNIITSPFVCQWLAYITYVSSFLSVWFVVGFTSERYVAISHPLHAKLLCSQTRERVAVFILLLFACILYSFAFWTSDAKKTYEKIRCGYRQQHIEFLQIVTWADTAITMLIPFTLILLMNLGVVYRASKFHKKRKQCLQPKETKRMKHNQNLRSKPQMRLTRTLLIVSTTFLILNLPSHTLRLVNLISSLRAQRQTILMSQYMIQEITQIIYYTTFSVNFFLYAMYGRHFQRSLVLMFESLAYKAKCHSRMTYIERSSTIRSWTRSECSSFRR